VVLVFDDFVNIIVEPKGRTFAKLIYVDHCGTPVLSV
jgi:hypothetical protein